ncbi:MAG: hypothetical protein ACKOCT_09055 [Alphaproteobacteria bacterium]
MRSRRPGIGEVMLVATIVLAGGWLREMHAATPPSWWNQVGPACSIAALPLAWCVGRIAGGPVAGIALVALLAVCPPAILSAPRAWPDSLTVALAFVNLLAFGFLLAAPWRIARLLAWGVSCIALARAEVRGVFPIALEVAALAWSVLGARGQADPRSRELAPGRAAVAPLVAIALVAVGTGLVLATAGSAAWGGTPARPGRPDRNAWEAWLEVLGFFAGGNRLLLVFFAISTPLAAVLAWPRGGVRRTLSLVAFAAPLALPLLLAIARSNPSDFHPRHAFFLLPTKLLSASIVAAWLARRALLAAGVRHERLRLAGAFAVALYAVATASTWIGAYVAGPAPGTPTAKPRSGVRFVPRPGAEPGVAPRTAPAGAPAPGPASAAPAPARDAAPSAPAATMPNASADAASAPVPAR